MLSFVRGRTEEFLRACSRADTQPQAPDLTESHSSLATLMLKIHCAFQATPGTLAAAAPFLKIT
jgi:hypothetical protein